MAEVSRHIQSRISRICVKITIFARMFISSLPVSMPTKLSRVVTYNERLPHIKSCDSMISWSCEVTWQTKNISTTRVAVATRLSRIATYIHGLRPIKSHDGLTIWSCKIPWQTKSIISPLPQCLWPPNLAGWWLANHKVIKLWSGGFCNVMSKMKTILSLECLRPTNLAGW